MKKSVLTEKELAQALGISQWTIRNWRKSAGLPYFGTTGRIFYREESVKRWMEQEEEKNSQRTSAKRPHKPTIL